MGFQRIETVAEVKEAVVEAIQLLQEVNPPEQLSAALKGSYELVYSFDTQSFLNYYKGILSFSALEKLIGINQKQLQHYSSGHRKPRPEQKKKIEAALHKLGQELLEVEL